MARVLAVDWDHSEVRFLYGTFSGDRLILLKAGAEPIGAGSAADEDSPSEEDSSALSEDGVSEKEPGETASESLESDDADIPISDGDDDSGGEEAAGESVSKKKGAPKDKVSVERGEALKRLLRREKIPAGPILLALPRGRVELLNLSLPKLTESELPDIVKNQVLRDSATYSEGHPLDFIPLGTPKGGTQKIISASITRVELHHLKTFTSAAGRKPAKMELQLTSLAEFVRSGKISAEQPVLLAQEGSDEINFAIFEQGTPIYFRAIQVSPELSLPEREKRLKTEILRTLQIGSGENPVKSVILFGSEEDYAGLIEELDAQEIQAETADPFKFGGIELQLETIPAHPALYAPLIGLLLAERGKKEIPILDLLHPRQKPKPPNYTIHALAVLVLLALLFGYGWHWNKKDLARKTAEVEQLSQQLSRLQGEYQQLLPQYTILDNTMKWENYGVVVLDELRDILGRLPAPPDLLISRMAYNGLDPQFGCPVFIISAKITQPEVYMRFYRNITAGGSYGINSRGVVQLPAATDDKDKKSFVYSFTAVILCKRRSPKEYQESLPPGVLAISNEKPEFYDKQIEAGRSQQVSNVNNNTQGAVNPPSNPQGQQQNQPQQVNRQ